MNTKNLCILPILITLFLITLCFFTSSNAQIIFRQDKPVIKQVWYRVTDYSPTLRSVEAAEISPDGKYVVSASKFGYFIMLWRVVDGFLLWQKVMDAEVEAVTFSPDGRLMVTGHEDSGSLILHMLSRVEMHRGRSASIQ